MKTQTSKQRGNIVGKVFKRKNYSFEHQRAIMFLLLEPYSNIIDMEVRTTIKYVNILTEHYGPLCLETSGLSSVLNCTQRQVRGSQYHFHGYNIEKGLSV